MSLQTTSNQTLPTRPLPVDLSDRPSRPTWAGASRFGYGVIILFFGVLGGWAALAPLASGVNARGSIQVDSGIKSVQHLEGGMVTEILVRDGERVEEGDVLLRLDPVATDAQSIVQRSSLTAMVVEQARLRAEVTGDESVVLDAELSQAYENPVLRRIIDGELKLFEERRASFAKQMSIRHERIAQIKTELDALKARSKTVDQQIALIEEELASVEEMFNKGYETKRRLLALKRAQTGLFGEKNSVEATIARAGQQINEQYLTIEAVKQSMRSDGVSRLKQLDLDVSRRRESIGILDDQINRIEVKAPSDGRIVNLQITTVGAVINRGQILMEVVPDNEAMVLEAKIKSKDIEQVKLGAAVQVRLTAFNPRLTPPVDGYVESVSANTFPEKKGQPSYHVVISLDPKSLKRSIGDQILTSGMPASGIIAVGERTLLEYLLTPLTASFELALREP